MRTLWLFFAIVCMLACNTSNFGSGSNKNDEERVAGTASDNKIRYRVGLRSARSLNLIMQSLTGEATDDENTDSNVGDNTGNNMMGGNANNDLNDGRTNNGMGQEVASASANSACIKKSKCAEFTVNSHGAKTCVRFAGFDLVGEGKIGNEFCGVSELLPSGGGAGVSSGGVLGLTGAAQVGVFKLGSAYCQQLMEDSSTGQQTRSQRLPEVAEQINDLNLNTRPADISEDLRSAIAKALIENFHGKLNARPDQKETEQVLVDLMSELSSVQEDNSNTTSNQEVLIGACTAALSSAQVTFY